MLNSNDTQQVSRFHPRTPPGRPMEVGWLQALGRWCWHRFVLPADEAQPWPQWMHRVIKPPIIWLATLLNIRNPRSLRSWIVHLLFVRPAHKEWMDTRMYLRARRQPGVTLDHVLQDVVYPRVGPAMDAVSQLIETRSLQLSKAFLRAGPVVRYGVMGLIVVLFVVAATTPLTLGQQYWVLITMWLLTLGVRQLSGYGPGVIMISLSLIASSRYIWWRFTQTLEFDSTLEAFLGSGLLLAECYTWINMVMGYIQNARPLRRKPVPLPANRHNWPTVDIYIPTYNEPLKVVKPTVLAALSLDWPPEKLHVYLLDDGRRDEFKRFAEECGAGYIIRPDNFHAKAGNLNHALTKTRSEFVAIFDCDHIPVSSFLTTTMGWFLKDPRCAMLQTPHHFFSPDPFERNLGTFKRVPNEGNLFYGLIQDGNDLWNAAFFCGSCAVLRRGPLLEVGGIAVETVTEDAHTALKLHRRGYTTAYLRQVLAGGLATESLSGHIGQRIRWARGMAQIFRIDNPFLGKGLSFFQRLCYSNAMLAFFSGLPRLVFLTSPLSYLFFELHVINAQAAALAAYAIPHIVQSSLANSHIQGRFRHSFWNEAYEAVLSWYIARPTTMALINPKLGKFNVTAKGGLVEHDFFDWRISAPYIVLVLLNVAGVLIAIPRMLFWNAHEVDTVAINLVWTLFNLVLLGAVLGVAAETRQVREAHRVIKKMPGVLHLPDGTLLPCNTEDFSMGGLGVNCVVASRMKAGDKVVIALNVEGSGEECRFPMRVASVRRQLLGLTLDNLTIEQERNFVRCTFAAPSVWQDWGKDADVDHPLESFAEVFAFGATGYVRLFESVQSAFQSWWRADAEVAMRVKS